jgi:hypothetical protein
MVRKGSIPKSRSVSFAGVSPPDSIPVQACWRVPGRTRVARCPDSSTRLQQAEPASRGFGALRTSRGRATAAQRDAAHVLLAAARLSARSRSGRRSQRNRRSPAAATTKQHVGGLALSTTCGFSAAGRAAMPSLRSSPVIRRSPQPEYFRASRRINARTSRPIGGRPGRRHGCVQRPATSRRCQSVRLTPPAGLGRAHRSAGGPPGGEEPAIRDGARESRTPWFTRRAPGDGAADASARRKRRRSPQILGALHPLSHGCPPGL